MLDASSSYDPGDVSHVAKADDSDTVASTAGSAASNLLFQWQCYDEDNNICPGLILSRTETNTIGAGALADGTYKFVVFVSNGDVIPASDRLIGNATATIQVSVNAAPPVTMSSIDDRISSQRTSYAMSAYVYTSAGCAAPQYYLWALVRTYDGQQNPEDSLLPVPVEDVMTPAMIEAQFSSVSATVDSLGYLYVTVVDDYFPTTALVQGETYKYFLFVADSSEAMSQAKSQIERSLNVPTNLAVSVITSEAFTIDYVPSVGSVSVSPVSGLAITQDFTLLQSQWVDEDPDSLLYAFFLWNIEDALSDPDVVAELAANITLVYNLTGGDAGGGTLPAFPTPDVPLSEIDFTSSLTDNSYKKYNIRKLRDYDRSTTFAPVNLNAGSYYVVGFVKDKLNAVATSLAGLYVRVKTLSADEALSALEDMLASNDPDAITNLVASLVDTPVNVSASQQAAVADSLVNSLGAALGVGDVDSETAANVADTLSAVVGANADVMSQDQLSEA